MTILIRIAEFLAAWFVLSVLVGLFLGAVLAYGQRLVEPQDDEERV